jgi:hypothetical protein
MTPAQFQVNFSYQNIRGKDREGAVLPTPIKAYTPLIILVVSTFQADRNIATVHDYHLYKANNSSYRGVIPLRFTWYF